MILPRTFIRKLIFKLLHKHIQYIHTIISDRSNILNNYQIRMIQFFFLIYLNYITSIILTTVLIFK